MPIATEASESSAWGRQSFGMVIGICLVIAMAATFGTLAIMRFQAAEASWVSYMQRATATRELFADLKQNIGYGGFIHNFKNLVLRRDLPRYQVAIERNLSGLNEDLDRIGGLTTTPAEQAALAQVRATFAEYARNYRKAVSLIKAGKSPEEIDAAVKVSDTAALAAIRELTAQSIERAHRAERQAQAHQHSALLFLKLGGLLVLGAFVAAAAVMIQFQKRLVAANDAKKGFLASMSHEIRTPMNAILGLAYLLEKSDLPAEAGKLAGKIVAAGRSLLRIIDDILDFSKIEAGRLEIERAPFYLSEVLENLATIMASYASNKDIELVIATPPSGDRYLRGDAQRVGQILINLVGNAIKFTDSGHVEVAIEVLEETADQSTLRFAVRDTGIGISEEQQRIIFAPFSQADSSITRRFGGTGLGLTISRRLVDLMGGELNLRSRPAGGTEFWFTLNLERLQGSRFSAPEMVNLSVLIADDSPVAKEALRNTAVGLGWSAVAVNSGEEVLRHVRSKAQTQAADEVLIVDWRMPGMNGLATARAVREALPNLHHPIILMVTAYSREELLADPDSALADAVLSKPVTPSSLYDAVAQVQRKRQGDAAPAVKLSMERRLEHVRMLVADDSDINREVALRIFSGEGAQVALVEDGKQALDWLRGHAHEVDIVLMDLQMPVMDGYTATRRIRDHLGLTTLPVIALTAGAFKEQQDAAAAAGMTDYVAKPFDVEAAVALILKYVGDAHQEGRAHAPPDGVPDALPGGDLPGLAVSRGLAIWKDAGAYKRYLRKFAREYRDCARTMALAEPAVAAKTAHKLTGAAGSLALTDVAAIAARADGVLRRQENASGVLAELDAAIQVTVDSIRRYAPDEAPIEAAPLMVDDPHSLAPLLLRALSAFNSDNTDAVRPILSELEQLLPPAHLTGLYSAVENFDFRGGETVTRTLAVELGISLED